MLFSMLLCYAIPFFILVFTWCLCRRVGRRTSQNYSEPLANQTNLSANSTCETEEKCSNRKELGTTTSSIDAEILAKDAKIADLEERLQFLIKTIESRMNSIDAIREAKEKYRKLKRTISSLRVEMRMSRMSKNAKNQFKWTISSLRAEIATKDVEIADLKKMLDSILKNTETLATSIKALEAANENHHITETTIRARFTKISELADVFVYSQPAHLAGIDWRIYVYKKDDQLAIFLDGEKSSASEWSCSAFVELQLISQKNEEVGLVNKFTKAEVYKGTSSWGFSEFISFKDLHDEEKGYVEDDSIIIAAVIKAFPSN